MLTFQEFILEGRIPIKDAYLYHMTFEYHVPSILSLGKLIQPYHLEPTGHRQNFDNFNYRSQGRVHFTNWPERWIDSLSAVSYDDLVVFRMKRSTTRKYDWYIPEYIMIQHQHASRKPDLAEDVYTTKPVPLKDLEVLNPRGMYFEPAIYLEEEGHGIPPASIPTNKL